MVVVTSNATDASATASAAPLPVKTRDDDYNVLMEIGSGAYGDVSAAALSTSLLPVFLRFLRPPCCQYAQVYLCERKADGTKLCMKELELHFLSASERYAIHSLSVVSSVSSTKAWLSHA